MANAGHITVGVVYIRLKVGCNGAGDGYIKADGGHIGAKVNYISARDGYIVCGGECSGARESCIGARGNRFGAKVFGGRAKKCVARASEISIIPRAVTRRQKPRFPQTA